VSAGSIAPSSISHGGDALWAILDAAAGSASAGRRAADVRRASTRGPKVVAPTDGIDTTGRLWFGPVGAHAYHLKRAAPSYWTRIGAVRLPGCTAR
jgi:hypothetical protein